MDEVKEKPTLKKFIKAVRDNFPFSEITENQVEKLASIFDRYSRDDLGKAYKEAIRINSASPLETIYKYLIEKPNRKFVHGLRMESGTDWDLIYSRIDRRMDIAKKNYNSRHGKGAWNRDNKKLGDLIHDDFVMMEDGKSIPQKRAEKVENLRKSLGYDAYTINS